TFMDMSSSEQIPVAAGIVGGGASWLSEGATAQVAMHQGTPIGVELPASVTLAITKTQPAVKGDTKTNAMKPAVLETGAEIQVPMFVEEGERVKVDTRSGAYMERVKWPLELAQAGAAPRDRDPVPGRRDRERRTFGPRWLGRVRTDRASVHARARRGGE